MIDVEQVLGGLEEISDQLDMIERGMDKQELVLGHDALGDHPDVGNRQD